MGEVESADTAADGAVAHDTVDASSESGLKDTSGAAAVLLPNFSVNC